MVVTKKLLARVTDHYPVRSNGRVRIFPSQALETL